MPGYRAGAVPLAAGRPEAVGDLRDGDAEGIGWES